METPKPSYDDIIEYLNEFTNSNSKLDALNKYLNEKINKIESLPMTRDSVNYYSAYKEILNLLQN